MPRRWIPQPQERFAWGYRRAHTVHDLEPAGRYERAGFGSPAGYRGAYEERPEYWLPRGYLYPPEPGGSGWPHELHTIPRQDEERHLRALRDRELASSVDAELYHVIDPEQADRISVYADDAVITLAGRVDRPATARAALEAAWQVPGVRRVRNALAWPGRGAPRRRRRGAWPR